MVSLISTEVAPGISSRCSNPRPRSTGVPMVPRKFRVTELYLISKGRRVGEFRSSGKSYVLKHAVVRQAQRSAHRSGHAANSRHSFKMRDHVVDTTAVSRRHPPTTPAAVDCVQNPSRPTAYSRSYAPARPRTPAASWQWQLQPLPASCAEAKRRLVETPNAASPFKAGSRSGRADFHAGARPKSTMVINATARLKISTRESN